ncbi:MAG TPA: kelch repeat-containing protein [Acidimicrobiales bacterium]|nr:kelch repeat-containing protein [Acidimicrobiales bacterium]
MSVPRADFTATLMTNGKVLLAGGETGATTDTPTVDIFDPVTNSITPAAGMKTARNGHTATLLPNGKVMVVGGTATPGGTALTSVEAYDPTSNTWSDLPSMSYGRVHHAAVLMVNGKVLVAGGTDAPTPVERYDPATNTWTSVAIPANDPRPSGPTATTLPGGRVMIVGGANGGAHTVNADVWIYDPATGQLTTDHAYPFQGGTNWATATLLGDGKVLVAGGEDSTNPAGAVATTYFFDPVADAAPDGPPMNVGHCHDTATMLKSGLVLVAGGRCGAQDSINVCELYDPRTNQWLTAGALQDARGFHVAVLLPDGRVLVAGGFYPGGSIAQTTELYKPA